MAQGDPTSTGYAAGTPTVHLASRRAARTTTVGSNPIEVQGVTHELIGPISGRKAVTTAGTRVALLATTPARRVIVQYSSGSGIIVVGGSTVVASESTRVGFALYAVGDFVELDCNDLGEVYIDSTVSADAVSFNYWTL